MFGGSTDTAFADGDAGACRQHDIDQGDLVAVPRRSCAVRRRGRRVGGIRPAFSRAHRPESRPGCAPARAVASGARPGAHNRSILWSAKRFFGFGELDIGAPEFFRAPVDHVTAQQIAALAQPRPVAPSARLAPAKAGQAVACRLPPPPETVPQRGVFLPSNRPTRWAISSGFCLRFAQAASIFPAPLRCASQTAHAWLVPSAGVARCGTE